MNDMVLRFRDDGPAICPTCGQVARGYRIAEPVTMSRVALDTRQLFAEPCGHEVSRVEGIYT